MQVKILIERQISFEQEILVEAANVEAARQEALRIAPDLVFYIKNPTEHRILTIKEVK
jgi:hypothetical protein